MACRSYSKINRTYALIYRSMKGWLGPDATEKGCIVCGDKPERYVRHPAVMNISRGAGNDKNIINNSHAIQ